MREKRKNSILIGVAVFIIVLSVVFVVNRRDPVVVELVIESTRETNSVETFVPENTKPIEVSPKEGTIDTTENILDAVLVIPTARTGLESTNPETVKLASGDIQFVELFAFW